MINILSYGKRNLTPQLIIHAMAESFHGAGEFEKVNGQALAYHEQKTKLPTMDLSCPYHE